MCADTPERGVCQLLLWRGFLDVHDVPANDLVAGALRDVDPGFRTRVHGRVTVTVVCSGGAIVLTGLYDAGALLLVTACSGRGCSISRRRQGEGPAKRQS